MRLCFWRNKFFLLLVLLILSSSILFAEKGSASGTLNISPSLPWWAWSFLLFILSLFLGILAITAGIGGGILYVPIVGLFFPFHLDFIRGAGLLVATLGAISATPKFLKNGMGSLRLALPMAFFSSMGTLIGANLGLNFSSNLVELCLGLVILGVVVLMCMTKLSENPEIKNPDSVALYLGVTGEYLEKGTGSLVQWTVHRMKWGFLVFFLIGFIAGIFGLGGGWANVPALNLLLGAPLKVSIATSILLVAFNGSVASWVYINQGAVLPIIAIPSILGMMLGTRLGAGLLNHIKASILRWLVIGVLVLAGLQSILSGTGVLP